MESSINRSNVVNVDSTGIIFCWDRKASETDTFASRITLIIIYHSEDAISKFCEITASSFRVKKKKKRSINPIPRDTRMIKID